LERGVRRSSKNRFASSKEGKKPGMKRGLGNIEIWSTEEGDVVREKGESVGLLRRPHAIKTK